MTRCFLAFELTEASRDYLRERVEPFHQELRASGWPVRLVPPENWHLTLLFFNDLSAEEREAVWAPAARLAEAGTWRDLRFDWNGLAVWPTPRRPSLVCVEAAPYAPAQDWPVLHWLDEEPFAKADTRHMLPYVPHITVMRFDRKRRRPVAREWEAMSSELPGFDPAAIRVDRLAFFLSTVSPRQPVYPRERSTPL